MKVYNNISALIMLRLFQITSPKVRVHCIKDLTGNSKDIQKLYYAYGFQLYIDWNNHSTLQHIKYYFDVRVLAWRGAFTTQ